MVAAGQVSGDDPAESTHATGNQADRAGADPHRRAGGHVGRTQSADQPCAAHVADLGIRPVPLGQRAVDTLRRREIAADPDRAEPHVRHGQPGRAGKRR
ncbi:hypothetical protein, partial [Micromonospora sp. ATCC 39149]|uniref:hypothetical protein n=1 Tax=Micromonospora sp. (strain ATCC 39149 / NRRL 15099 / SCC 1413) TaxID=219305 RepID=UPI00350FE66A